MSERLRVTFAVTVQNAQILVDGQGLETFLAQDPKYTTDHMRSILNLPKSPLGIQALCSVKMRGFTQTSALSLHQKNHEVHGRGGRYAGAGYPHRRRQQATVHQPRLGADSSIEAGSGNEVVAVEETPETLSPGVGFEHWASDYIKATFHIFDSYTQGSKPKPMEPKNAEPIVVADPPSRRYRMQWLRLARILDYDDHNHTGLPD